MFNARHFRSLFFRARYFGNSDIIDGPFVVAAGQIFLPGAISGQVFCAGSVAGQVFVAGNVAGQVR